MKTRLFDFKLMPDDNIDVSGLGKRWKQKISFTGSFQLSSDSPIKQGTKIKFYTNEKDYIEGELQLSSLLEDDSIHGVIKIDGLIPGWDRDHKEVD